MVLFLILFSILPFLVVEAQYGMSNYYNRCYNYCGYNPLTYSGYGLNNQMGMGYLRPGGGYLNPYSSVLGSNYYNQGYNQGFGGMPFGGSGILPYSTMDTLGYNNGMYGSGYQGSLPYLAPQHLNNFQSPMMNREPFMFGTDGLPFMGDFANPALLPRPFEMFDEGKNFNTPLLAPFRKHAAAGAATTTQSTQHPSPKKPKFDEKSGEPTYSTIISLDQLIKDMS